MNIRLDGRVAVVTGGSRGIGKAIAMTLARAGANVVIVSRKLEALELAVAEIRAETGSSEVWCVAANVGDEEAPNRVLGEVLDRYGQLDFLINNAGTNPHFGPLMTIQPGQADKIMQVNVRAIMLWTQAAWTMYFEGHEQARGAVVNLASIGGLAVDRSIGYYDVSKAGVIHLTRHLAAELGPRLRVNSISPGLVRTDMARALVERHEEALATSLPLRRIGEPEDIANAAFFLLSDLSSWMTGENIVVDGGALIAG